MVTVSELLLHCECVCRIVDMISSAKSRRVGTE